MSFHRTPAITVLLVASLFVELAADTHAGTLYWDPSVSGSSASTGVASTWSNTAIQWYSGSADTTWGDYSDAEFAGTAGSVTIGSSGVNVHNLTFDVSGYTVTGSGIITLGTTSTATGTPTINVYSAIATYTNGSSSLTMSSVLAGSVGLIKDGYGTLNLVGANTLTGGITVRKGLLNVQNTGALGSNAVDITAGAIVNIATSGIFSNAFTLNGMGQGGGTYGGGDYKASLFIDGHTKSVALSGLITLNSGSCSIGVYGDSSGTITGQITGSGNLVRGNGTRSADYGNLVISNTSNNYTGSTIINGGSLTLGASGVIPDASNLVFAANSISVADVLNMAGYSETVAGLSSVSGATAAIKNSGSGTSVLTVGYGTTGSYSSLFAGSITGAIAVTKIGAGLQTLSGTNSYTGVTTASVGTLQFAKEVSLYNNTSASWTASNIIVSSGATLALNVGGTGEFTATDVATLAALGSSTGGFQNGSILGLNTTNSGGTFTYSSVLADTNAGANSIGLTKLGAGMLTLGAANTYSGETAVYGGTLALGNSLALQYSTLDYNSYGGVLSFGTLTSATLGGLQGSQALALTNTSNTAVVLTVGSNSTSTSYSGILSGSGSLTKVGSGMLTLTGANSYTGVTTINGGTVALSGSGKIGTGSLVMTNSSVLDIGGGTATIGNAGAAGTGAGIVGSIQNGTLYLYGTLFMQSGAVSANLTGSSSSRVFIGGDTSANVYLSGDNSALSDVANAYYTFIIGHLSRGLAGTVSLGNAKALGNSLQVAQLISGTLDFNGITNVACGTIALATLETSGSSVTYLVNCSASDVNYAGQVLISTNNASNVGGSGNLTLSGNITANTVTASTYYTGGLTKTGTGVLTLSGVNSYTGATAISTGVLNLASANAVQYSTVNVGSNANALTFATGVNTFTLGGLQGSGNIALTNVTNLQVGNNNASTTYSGILSGGNTLTKVGTGVLTLSGIGVFTGTTSVVAGTLNVTGALVNNGYNSVYLTALGTASTGNAATLARAVLGGYSLAGCGSTGIGAFTTYATCLAGTASGASSLSMSWSDAIAAQRGVGTGTGIISEVLTMSGVNSTSSGYVLEMSYNVDALKLLTASGSTATSGIYIAYLPNSTSSTWTDLCLGKDKGAYSSTVTYAIGDWGLNSDNTIWVVTDKTSGSFAIVPEPGTFALLTCAMLSLIAYAWRRRKN